MVTVPVARQIGDRNQVRDTPVKNPRYHSHESFPGLQGFHAALDTERVSLRVSLEHYSPPSSLLHTSEVSGCNVRNAGT